MVSPLVAERRRLARLFDDDLPPTRAARVFQGALALLIIVNVAGIILESVDSFDRRFGVELWWIEQIATAFFAVEYVLRVWASTNFQNPRYRHPVWGRLRYMRSFFALVDLISVLPAILGMLGAGDLRTLRLLRLLRMLKLTRHATIFNLLWAVFREEARSIGAVLFILLLTLTISASLMYMIEGEAQPDGFSSIPAAMWWAVETLTTVGYGDLVPTTVVGKIMGGVVSIVGVAAVALFTSLITVSFLDQLRLRRAALRTAVETSLADGALSAGERAALEDLSERLGLPDTEPQETLETTQREPRVCPHCGAALSGARPA
ncbi:MAG: ion transporter [Alphaproteobacteria bacterium]|nr:ion transporter [Alphaproteobacteria bacterium]